MKENELMVGDWVMYNPNVFIEDEYETTKEWYPTRISNGVDIDLAIEGCYTPIPLTTEILEANGFELRDEHYILSEDYYDIDIWEYSDGIWIVRYDCCEMNMPSEIWTISYLHELQQFMRHCKIDKEIIL